MLDLETNQAYDHKTQRYVPNNLSKILSVRNLRDKVLRNDGGDYPRSIPALAMDYHRSGLIQAVGITYMMHLDPLFPSLKTGYLITSHPFKIP